MTELIRFGVSIEKGLLDVFDRFILDHGFHNRSEAIRDLIREKLSLQKGFGSENILGTITIVYNHHIRNLAENLTDIQHHYQKHILFSNHVHITHAHCLEVIVVRGDERILRDLTARIGGQKGVLMALPSFFSVEFEAAHEEHSHG
jgi:CopG family nickel-responsive transcriptional regulator